MAIALNIAAKMTVTAGGVPILTPVFSQSVTPSDQNTFTGTPTIGTSAQLLDLGNVTSPGYVLIANLDATNYVEIDLATGMNVWPQKILPGGLIVLQPQSATLYAKAHTAPVGIYISATSR